MQQYKIKSTDGLSIKDLDNMCRLHNKIIVTKLLPLVVISKQDNYGVGILCHHH